MQIVIGLTGGSGCGKTTALSALASLGVFVIDCDALYHHLLDTDMEMNQALAQAFPAAFSGGNLDRKALGRVVFGDQGALERLNALVWPFVRRAVISLLKDHAPQPCAIDAIGLWESGLGNLCTCTAAVTAPLEDRIRRLMARDHISRDYAILRIQAQKSDLEFSKACTVTLDNHYNTAEEFSEVCISTFSTILKEESLL